MDKKERERIKREGKRELLQEIYDIIFVEGANTTVTIGVKDIKFLAKLHGVKLKEEV